MPSRHSSLPPPAEGQRHGCDEFLGFVMIALAGPGIGWWMQKLAGGAALTEDLFVTAGSVYVAAIVVAAFLDRGSTCCATQESSAPKYLRRIIQIDRIQWRLVL
jgi:hypothetical protein